MKFDFALFFESGTCQPERAPLKGNFEWKGVMKAIYIIP
jgi:hypothetical protein